MDAGLKYQTIPNPPHILVNTEVNTTRKNAGKTQGVIIKLAPLSYPSSPRIPQPTLRPKTKALET